MWITRCAARASSSSCVTTTIVVPSALSRLEERDHLGAGARVELAGGLVGEQQLRLVRQRARDRDALLLAAGELRRPVAARAVRAPRRRAAARARVAPRSAAVSPASAIGSSTFSRAVSAGMR